MAQEAYAFYLAFDEHLAPAVDPGLTACGYVFVAESEDGLAELLTHVEFQRALGVPVSAISATEAAELVPGLNAEAILGASFCATDSYFDRPQAVVGAFAAACERSGGQVVGSAVVAIERAPGGWQLLLADKTRVTAEQIAIAAGAATAPLLTPLGLSLPIEPEPRHLFYSNPIRERLLEPLLVAPERRFAAKQLADGTVLASDLGASGDPDRRAVWYRNVRAAITELVPILEYVSFPVLVSGDYDVTPDRQPIVGPLPGLPGIWVAAGLNGRGFMMAPTVGRMLADAMAGQPPDEMLATLAAERFEHGALLPERQVV
jgi:sarcosine oxidase, subunit beta